MYDLLHFASTVVQVCRKHALLFRLWSACDAHFNDIINNYLYRRRTIPPILPGPLARCSISNHNPPCSVSGLHAASLLL